ncbi:hypothetical protein EZS27_012934 [termite gut metagenome]|uniref:Uncharacterized protein n=1 Tax=termite gut metagenome TaxID=433724 RepID=A0A5J4RZX9_9ZZZZ
MGNSPIEWKIYIIVDSTTQCNCLIHGLKSLIFQRIKIKQFSWSSIQFMSEYLIFTHPYSW